MEENLIADEMQLLELVKEYIQAKGNSFAIIPMEDRVKMFLGCVKDCDYRKESFLRVQDFKNLFFPKDQLANSGIKNINEYLATFVIGDKSNNENRLVVLFNKLGINDKQELNNKNTSSYEISFKNNEVKQIELNNLKYKLNYDSYKLCKCKECDNSQNELFDKFKNYLAKTNTKQA